MKETYNDEIIKKAAAPLPLGGSSPPSATTSWSEHPQNGRGDTPLHSPLFHNIGNDISYTMKKVRESDSETVDELCAGSHTCAEDKTSAGGNTGGGLDPIPGAGVSGYAADWIDDIGEWSDNSDGKASGVAGAKHKSDYRRYSNVKVFARDILISFAVALLIVQFINPTIVKGQSMEPTLHDNNYIFLSKQQYTFSELRHGQIVVFKPGDALAYERKDNLLIKRVIALPGDELTIKGGEVILNGVCVQESYIMESYTSGHMESITIPDGCVFVMGDNRQHSLDSRSPDIGFVSEKQIIGMAFFRVFPFNQFGLIQ